LLTICEHDTLKRKCPHCELNELYKEFYAIQAERDRYKNFLIQFRERTPYGLYQEQIMDVLEGR